MRYLERRRQRRLGKPGGYARDQERRRYRELLVATWRYLVFVSVAWYALAFGLHLWVGRFNDVTFGAMLVIPPWAISLFLVSDAGAAAWSSGADGEEWTSGALRKALDREYVILDDIQLERRNIDHLVVGPGGLFVVETKWSSTPWRSYRGDMRLRQACKQASHYARHLQRRLEAAGFAPVPQPLVVLWGGRTRSWAPETRVRVVDRVTVIAGDGVREWAGRLSVGVLTADQRDELVRRLPEIAAS